jgi:lysophospholipase L1-like esterase
MSIRTRGGHALFMLGLSLGVLLLGEGVLRLALRLRAGAWPESQAVAFYRQMENALRLYRRHAYLNTAPREGAAVEAFGKRLSFNSLGYRSPARPLAKPAGVLRVLCAGGSTTLDLLAVDDASSWPWILEGRLSSATRPVEVWNAGFPGWTSLESLISFAIRDVDLAPDVLILYQGVNDLQPAAHHPFDRQYEHGHAEIAARALGFDLPPLHWFERSLLYEKARDLALAPQDPWRRLEEPGGEGRKLAPSISRAGVATFRRNIGSLLALTRARAVSVLVVTQTLRIRAAAADKDRRWLAGWTGLEADAAVRDLDAMNAVLRSLASDEVRVADLAAKLPLDDQDFADPAHFSSSGSGKMARYMAAEVEPLLARLRAPR